MINGQMLALYDEELDMIGSGAKWDLFKALGSSILGKTYRRVVAPMIVKAIGGVIGDSNAQLAESVAKSIYDIYMGQRAAKKQAPPEVPPRYDLGETDAPPPVPDRNVLINASPVNPPPVPRRRGEAELFTVGPSITAVPVSKPYYEPVVGEGRGGRRKKGSKAPAKKRTDQLIAEALKNAGLC